MPDASPIFKSAKGVKKRKKGVNAVEVHTFPSGGGGILFFIFKFLLDFRKDNLVILVIRSLFPYQ